MKLIAGLAALVAAKPEVLDCNAGPGGAAAMSMTIAKADVQQAPGAGWSLDGGVYKKTVQASTTNTAMGTTANVKELVMTHTVNSGGCEDVDIGGVVVCKAIGHEIVFTCTYPMDDQTLKNEKDFSVSGSDTEKTATKTGTLNYKLTVDKTAFDIGAKVTATITPATPGLVHATIENCSVKNKGNSQEINLVKDNMQRECALGVDVTAGQGTGNLGFLWNSFKWSTTLNQAKAADSSPDESQEVSCSISLSKAAPAKQTQNVCSGGAPASGDPASPVASTGTLLHSGKGCDAEPDRLTTKSNMNQADCHNHCSTLNGCKHFVYYDMSYLGNSSTRSACDFYSACAITKAGDFYIKSKAQIYSLN